MRARCPSMLLREMECDGVSNRKQRLEECTCGSICAVVHGPASFCDPFTPGRSGTAWDAQVASQIAEGSYKTLRLFGLARRSSTSKFFDLGSSER